MEQSAVAVDESMMCDKQRMPDVSDDNALPHFDSTETREYIISWTNVHSFLFMCYARSSELKADKSHICQGGDQ
jgi:hypothetical protein